jgi:1-acyl-sn-glycerol-3-phosphate acyltransferase
LKNEDGLVVFPEGTRSKTDEFLSPKPGIGMIARKSGSSVIPAYINGSNKFKASFLGRERLSIVYGEAMTSDEISAYEDNRVGYNRLAVDIMAKIKVLKDNFRHEIGDDRVKTV